MSLTAKDVAEILKALEASSFDTLDLELNGMKLQLRRSGAASGPAIPASRSPAAPAPVHAGHAAPVEVPPGTTPVAAPLLGIFYRAPRPGEPAFVEVGARASKPTPSSASSK